MKAPKFLKIIVALLICIAFIRAVNGSYTNVSTFDLLKEVKELKFDISKIVYAFKDLRNDTISTTTTWNNSLEGFNGFIQNLKNVLFGFFNMIKDTIKMIVVGLWTILYESARLLVEILDLICKICGLTIKQSEKYIGGYRGGR